MERRFLLDQRQRIDRWHRHDGRERVRSAGRRIPGIGPGRARTSPRATSRSDLNDDGGSNCDSRTGGRNHTISLDSLTVTVFYQYTSDLEPIASGQLLTDPNGNLAEPAGLLGHGHEPGRRDRSTATPTSRTTTTRRRRSNQPVLLLDQLLRLRRRASPSAASNGEVWIYDPRLLCGRASGQLRHRRSAGSAAAARR